MTNILGPYYAPHHHWQQDRDYVRALDPAWVRIHQPDALAVHEMTEAAPNARIMLRCWDIDDNNGERKREMYADPKGAARKHLDMWRAKWDAIVAESRRNNWAIDESKWYIGLVNEPDPAHVPQIVEYSLEAMRLVKGTSIRLGLVCSSVGTFSKPSENGDGWAKFKPLEAPMREGGHILIVHEYWQPEGPNYGEDAGNLAWRHRSIPLDVPILIGESGANGYIYGRYSKNDDSGWRVTVKDPNVYAAQVREYIEGCDKRVVGVLLYMLDYHSKQWESFYTGPAAQQLLAIKDARPQRPSPFATTQPTTPTQPVEPKPPKETPVATGIIEPRVAQAILKIESGGRSHGDDGRMIIRFEAHIFKTYLKNDAKWAEHFRTDPSRGWVDQMWRPTPSDTWRPIHTGKQADEYAALEFAKFLIGPVADPTRWDAAHKSISMGAPQIMGFNHARIGYRDATDMFDAFANAQLQTLGFINFCLSDPGLMDAMRNKDWRTIAAKYNGTGAVETYAPLLENAYKALGG